MASHTKVVTTQSQAMMTQSNRKVGPHVNQNDSTMASRLRYITRIDSPIFFRCKVNEILQNFLDKVYMIFFIRE